MTPTAAPPPPARTPRTSPGGRLPGTPLGRGPCSGSALGSVGTGSFSTVPGLLLLYYLTDVLGVAAAVAGLVVVLPKAWNIVFNPYVGAASDRQAIRRRTRTPLMLLGAVSLPAAFALMFAAVGSGPTAAAYVTVAFLVAATCYALFQVPYVALPAEMSESTHERSRIMGWRIVALTVGILVGGAVAQMIVTAGGGGAGLFSMLQSRHRPRVVNLRRAGHAVRLGAARNRARRRSGARPAARAVGPACDAVRPNRGRPDRQPPQLTWRVGAAAARSPASTVVVTPTREDP